MCIYYEKDEDKIVVGTCWITCFRYSYSIFRYSMENATKVNDDVCSGQALIEYPTASEIVLNI